MNSYHSFCWSRLIFCHHDTDTLDMCMKKYYFGTIILTNLQLCELRQFLCIVSNMGSMVVPMYRPINYYHSFCWSYLIICLHNTDTLDMCMKKYYFEKKIFLTKFQLFELRQFFVQVFNIYSKLCRYGPINSYHSFS